MSPLPGSSDDAQAAPVQTSAQAPAATTATTAQVPKLTWRRGLTVLVELVLVAGIAWALYQRRGDLAHALDLDLLDIALVLALCAAIVVALLSARMTAAQSVVEITDAWVRATVPGQQVAGAYLKIRSARAAKLIGVSSPVAKSAELHSMSNAGGVMRMRKLDSLALPPGERVELEAGGNHIMLFDIKRQLQPGEKVPITLIVEERGNRKTVKLEAEVRRE